MARSGDGWYEIGYRRDSRNRVFFTPVTGPYQERTVKMLVNQDGFLQFKDIIASTYERLQRSALARLDRHFTEHPESMPAVEQVGTFSEEYIEPVE